MNSTELNAYSGGDDYAGGYCFGGWYAIAVDARSKMPMCAPARCQPNRRNRNNLGTGF